MTTYMMTFKVRMCQGVHPRAAIIEALWHVWELGYLEGLSATPSVALGVIRGIQNG
jgi:hypothetical protein